MREMKMHHMTKVDGHLNLTLYMIVNHVKYGH